MKHDSTEGISPNFTMIFTMFREIKSYFTRFHHISPNFIILHQIAHISPNFTRFHQISHVSRDFTRFHKISPYFTRFHHVSPDFTRSHQISPCFARFHYISPYFTTFHHIQPPNNGEKELQQHDKKTRGELLGVQLVQAYAEARKLILFGGL